CLNAQCHAARRRMDETLYRAGSKIPSEDVARKQVSSVERRSAANGDALRGGRPWQDDEIGEFAGPHGGARDGKYQRDYNAGQSGQANHSSEKQRRSVVRTQLTAIDVAAG